MHCVFELLSSELGRQHANCTTGFQVTEAAVTYWLLIVLLLYHGDKGTLTQPYSSVRYSFHDMDYQYISIEVWISFHHRRNFGERKLGWWRGCLMVGEIPPGYDLVLEVCCKSLSLSLSLSAVKLCLCFPGYVGFSRQAYMQADSGTLFGKLPW
jgi:hypothetical protein